MAKKKVSVVADRPAALLVADGAAAPLVADGPASKKTKSAEPLPEPAAVASFIFDLEANAGGVAKVLSFDDDLGKVIASRQAKVAAAGIPGAPALPRFSQTPEAVNVVWLCMTGMDLHEAVAERRLTVFFKDVAQTLKDGGHFHRLKMQSPRATTCNDIYLGGLKVNKTVGPSSKTGDGDDVEKGVAAVAPVAGMQAWYVQTHLKALAQYKSDQEAADPLNPRKALGEAARLVACERNAGTMYKRARGPRGGGDARGARCAPGMVRGDGRAVRR